jgi:hypothetical protein
VRCKITVAYYLMVHAFLFDLESKEFTPLPFVNQRVFATL